MLEFVSFIIGVVIGLATDPRGPGRGAGWGDNMISPGWFLIAFLILMAFGFYFSQ